MTSTVDSLPDYLKQYCIQQAPDQYTSRDHAAWRCIMQRALRFFRKTAISGYEEGLRKTGLPVDQIPSISNIDSCLQEFGWGAVPVCGFIPPWAFLDFQSRSILPIATDMRQVDHIAYTPAPDIVHEAAGHAPILPNETYRNYLTYYAKLGTKAIYSRWDLQLYEAVRHLSDIKEKPESTHQAIQESEINLKRAVANFEFVSEAAKIGRMSWWTAEYGLLGPLENPKIFGAGLLSSVGESQECLSSKVKKIPLSVECLNYSFNITEPQPQLFVARDMQHLVDVLEEVDKTLSYHSGNQSGLEQAISAEAVTTMRLDSGIQISGILSQSIPCSDHAHPAYFQYRGPVQICWQDRELSGQGISRHPDGFGFPVGRWAAFPDKDPAFLTKSQMNQQKISIGKNAVIEFHSGVTIKGTVKDIVFQKDQLLYITWVDCLVTFGSQVLFEPSWGLYDMIVGTSAVSICGGPADRESYGNTENVQASTQPGRTSPYSPIELDMFQLYTDIRSVRNRKSSKNQKWVEDQVGWVLKNNPREWLLLLEFYQLSVNEFQLNPLHLSWLQKLKDHLSDHAIFNRDIREMTSSGMENDLLSS